MIALYDIDERIMRWNEDRGNCEEFDIELERRLLIEEKQEFIDAFIRGNIIDMIDAWADITFVLGGTKWKYLKLYNQPHKEIEDLIDYFDDFTDVVKIITQDKIKNEYDVYIDLYPFLTNVVEANQQKTSEKDETGKIKKPEGFIPPEQRHEETLKLQIKKEKQEKHILESPNI